MDMDQQANNVKNYTEIIENITVKICIREYVNINGEFFHTTEICFSGYGTFGIIYSPTGNCQVCSAYNMQTILARNTLATSSFVKKLFECLRKYIPLKNIILFDIRSDLSTVFENLIDEYISKTPYVSTNGSNMILYLVKSYKL